jgi:hypothetical protein
VYIAGWHSGTTDFDPGSGTFNLTSSNAAAGAASDLFLAKYTGSGAFLWADQFGGSVSDQTLSSIVAGMAVDRNGNAYITGQTYGTTDFDPGPGTTNYVPVGLNDAFLAMYDPLGNLADNAAPTATPQTRSTNAGTPLNLTLGGDDGDPEVVQTLTYSIATNPGHGALSGFNSATGQVTYTPAAGYSGTDSFTFTVTDDIFAGGPSRISSAATITTDVVDPLGPSIVVGDWLVPAGETAWMIPISVTGGVSVDGINFNIQIDDGSKPVAEVGPVFTGLNILTGTIFDGKNTGSWDNNVLDWVAWDWTETTAGETVYADGVIGYITLDTVDCPSGTWQLAMSDTLNGPTDFAGAAATIVDGTITVTPDPFPWQNADQAEDVDASGQVTPLDVLIVINWINANGTGPVPAPVPNPAGPPPFLDVSGDNLVAPVDVLLVINYINSHPFLGSQAAEGEELAAIADSPAPSGATRAVQPAEDGGNQATVSHRVTANEPGETSDPALPWTASVDEAFGQDQDLALPTRWDQMLGVLAPAWNSGDDHVLETLPTSHHRLWPGDPAVRLGCTCHGEDCRTPRRSICRDSGRGRSVVESGCVHDGGLERRPRLRLPPRRSLGRRR